MSIYLYCGTIFTKGKAIKFERKSTWFIMLNKEANKVTKMMAKTTTVEVFEK